MKVQVNAEDYYIADALHTIASHIENTDILDEVYDGKTPHITIEEDHFSAVISNEGKGFKVGDQVSKPGFFHTGTIVDIKGDIVYVKTNEKETVYVPIEVLCHEKDVVHNVILSDQCPYETNVTRILLTTKDLNKAVAKVKEIRDQFIADKGIDLDNVEDVNTWGITDDYDDFESSHCDEGDYSVWIMTTKIE